MVKERARQKTVLGLPICRHPRFREMCINLAQSMYRTEIRLRTNILGEAAKPAHVRPLSETRAIDQGANFIAEGFMFSVAAILILGETYRSSRSQSKRRDSVDDQLEDLTTGLTELKARVDTLADKWETQLQEEKQRNDELARILERVVEIGLRGGWAEFEGTPLQLPRIQLTARPVTSALSSRPNAFDSTESEPHSISDLSPAETDIGGEGANTTETKSGDDGGGSKA
ncbi:hypothetical protein NMY22_g17591 [Coprinellus aureogranulatus]|nr:hypothetical protein NMY22_g17591 [Coprinellus aureogranulatus]